MVSLSPADKRELENAVAEAEKGTRAEIVLAVADLCDDYRIYTLPYAAAFGFVLFGALALFLPEMHVRMAFLVTGAATLVAALALQWHPLRLATVPRAVRDEAAERLAQHEYAALVAGRTAEANGLLIFVALGEHHAEIVAEPGLAAKVPPETWQKIMDGLTADLRAGRTMAGLKAAIAACGAAAAEAFPGAASDRDELANAPRDTASL